MRRRSALVCMILALGGASCTDAAEMRGDKPRPSPLRRQGDPDRAVRAELDAARRAGTLAAYDLFLARQRQHPLAEIARQERSAITARREK